MKLWHWAILTVVFVGACVVFDRVANRLDYGIPASGEIRYSDSTYTVAWVRQDPDGMRTMTAHVVHGGRDSVYRNGVLWSVGAVTRFTPTRGTEVVGHMLRWYESPDPLTPTQVDRLARIWEAKR